MKPKIIIGLILSITMLTFFAEGILAAKKARHRPPLIESLDGAEPPEAYRVPSPVMYEVAMQPDCEDIHPEIGYNHVVQHDQFGSTYYDYQRNGSVGRMIAVGPMGHRHMVFHETRGPYGPDYPRYITYNCKDPLETWLGPTYADGGEGLNAGYGNIDVLRDGRAVLNHHRTAGDPCWYTVLAVEDSVCSGSFTNIYDLPDYFTGRTEQGMWPKMCVCPVGDTDYMHIVMTEGKTTGGNQYLGYLRCHLIAGGNLVCETPDNGQQGVVTPVTLAPNIAGGGELSPIAYFGECEDPNCQPGEYPNNISAVVATSPVSQKVAIVYTNKKESGSQSSNNDVFYFESTNNGMEWFPQLGGTWPPTLDNGMLTNITQYPEDYPERAYTDLAACYDYQDTLHIVWNSCQYDVATFDASLMHWVDTDPPGINNASIVATAYWDDGTYGCGGWNRNICKMSISAKPPEYHPGEPSYLFCTWTQFGPDDVAANEFANGDIYAAVSNDGGQCWSPGYNLTNTNTDGCPPGECLSEHWSSLAENMYDGHLHIQYACDRDAGGAIMEGEWTDNPMMYLHAVIPDTPLCMVEIDFIDPPDWCYPPLKVVPGQERIIVMELTGLYFIGGGYEVTTDNPNIVPTLNGSGYLAPQQTIPVELTIFCQQEGFLVVRIFVRGCIWTHCDWTDTIYLHVVQSEDYYECDRDPVTFIEKDNNTLRLRICVNTSQEVWDQRIGDEERQKVIFSAGPIVATTWQGDTVVGRQDNKDVLTGARDTIHNVVGIDPVDSNCALQVVWSEKTFICANNLPPPNHQRWWWIQISQRIFVWHDTLAECPHWKKEQIIKQIWITRSQYPAWWPNSPAEQYEDIWFGYFADLDAPFDEGCHGCNVAGYDYDREMAWLHGWYNDTLPEGHSEYEDYYVGVTFTDRDGNVVEPLGMQVVINDSFLYSQDGWGWKDGELYQLAATPGVNVHHPDSVADRSVILTADMIPAGNDTLFESELILIEALIQGDPGQGLTRLQAHTDSTREVLIPELDEYGVFSEKFPLCGDVNNDEIINSADVVYLINYLFKFGPDPMWPINRADVNNDEVINSADIVYLINYLFKAGPSPVCSGFGRD